MKDRMIKFMSEENLTSAKLADIINVQPSSISHMLSGRNKPGFDFIAKVLSNFPHLNAEWLIIGKGTMYKSQKQATLFDTQNNEAVNSFKNDEPDLKISDKSSINTEEIKSEEVNTAVDKNKSFQNTDIERIIIFYNDSSFKEYIPKSKK